MRASEHQTQPPVGEVGGIHRGGRLRDRQQQPVGGRFAGAPAPRHVDHPPAGRGEEPGFRSLRRAADRPAGERSSIRVGKRILGRRDIASARGEIGEQLAVALPRRASGRALRRRRADHIAQIGRTSTVP
jgi:hypothetical protein